MSAFLDTNVIIRHLTGDPPEMAAAATAYLAAHDELFVPDLIVAEVVYVLESFYEVPRTEVARLARSLVGFRAVVTIDPALLLRALDVYETARLDFADAYLVACAETTEVGEIVSFDRGLDRVTTVRRIEPGK